MIKKYVLALITDSYQLEFLHKEFDTKQEAENKIKDILADQTMCFDKITILEVWTKLA